MHFRYQTTFTVFTYIVLRTLVQGVSVNENTRSIYAFDRGKQNANATTAARFEIHK